jgi:hypothetical protein
MRNQTHALYIEYFNLEASPVNKMPSCVLPKNIIVDAKMEETYDIIFETSEIIYSTCMPFYSILKYGD